METVVLHRPRKTSLEKYVIQKERVFEDCAIKAYYMLGASCYGNVGFILNSRSLTLELHCPLISQHNHILTDCGTLEI